MPRGVVPSDGGCGQFWTAGIAYPKNVARLFLLVLVLFHVDFLLTVSWQGTYHWRAAMLQQRSESEWVRAMHGSPLMRTDSLAPLCTAPSFAGCSARHSNADGCPCGFRESPRPGMGQGDRRFVLQARSSGRWRRRVQTAASVSASGTTHLEDTRLVSRRRSDGDGAAVLVARGRSRPTLALEALADWRVRRGASHGQARLFRHRAAHRLDDRAAFRLRETTFGTRGWFRAGSRRSGRRQHRGLHARSRPRARARRSVRSKRCSRQRRCPDFDAEPTIRQISRLCRASCIPCCDNPTRT